MNIGPMEWLVIGMIVMLPVLALTALVLLMRRARPSDPPEERARIQELEARVQELERQGR